MGRGERGRFLKVTGMHIDDKGYWRYSAGPLRHKRVHRHLMEEHLGRKLRKDEHVHHINGVKTDNRIENMQALGEREHNAVSSKQYWFLKTNIWPREKAACDALGVSA